MATKKAGGSTSLGRDSIGKRLGVKKNDGEWADAGSILIRQRGTKYHPGVNVIIGKDDTLLAKISGYVKFTDKKKICFDKRLKKIKVVSVTAKK